MDVKLPVPIPECDTVNVGELKGGVIADAKKILVNEGNPYKAMRTFVTGSIVIDGVSNNIDIVNKMPYKTMETVLIKILTQNKHDTIEGVYPCPMCGMKKYRTGENSDHISDLETVYSENKPIDFELSNPVLINAMEDYNIDKVSTLTLNYPTTLNVIVAYENQGKKDSLRLQYRIWIEALIKVNGIEVESKFKNRYGMQIFENMIKDDLQAVQKKIDYIGLITTKKFTCNDCGQEWEETLNTSNFFDSIL